MCRYMLLHIPQSCTPVGMLNTSSSSSISENNGTSTLTAHPFMFTKSRLGLCGEANIIPTPPTSYHRINLASGLRSAQRSQHLGRMRGTETLRVWRWSRCWQHLATWLTGPQLDCGMKFTSKRRFLGILVGRACYIPEHHRAM